MNKQNLLTLTLIISGLALNPVMADAVANTVASTQTINHSVSTSIYTVLYNRGLEEKTANELASTMVDEEDEMFLAMLLQTLDAKNIASREEVLEYLSTAALHKRSIDFKKYDNLVGMVSKIKKRALDENTLKQLSYLAKVNKQLFV
jgi:hypothetical protein